jgi:hypothetical protein
MLTLPLTRRYIKPVAVLCFCAVIACLALYGPTWLHVIAAFILAYTLYRLRKTQRLTYGIIEVTAGFATLLATYPSVRKTCGTFAESCQPIPPYVVALGTLTAIYVLIRGFDNVEQGRTQSATKE